MEAFQSGSEAADLGDVLLRATFFSDEEPEDFGPDKRSIHDVAEAIDQVARLMEASFVLADWEQVHRFGEGEVTGAQRWSEAEGAAFKYVEIVSISMESPLTVIVKIAAEVVAKLAGTVVDLGERVCTFGPRVSADRAEQKVRKALATRQKTLIEEGRADAMALQLVASTLGGRGVRPTRIDFLDPEKPRDDDLISIKSLRLG